MYVYGIKRLSFINIPEKKLLVKANDIMDLITIVLRTNSITPNMYKRRKGTFFRYEELACFHTFSTIYQGGSGCLRRPEYLSIFVFLFCLYTSFVTGFGLHQLLNHCFNAVTYVLTILQQTVRFRLLWTYLSARTPSSLHYPLPTLTPNIQCIILLQVRRESRWFVISPYSPTHLHNQEHLCDVLAKNIPDDITVTAVADLSSLVMTRNPSYFYETWPNCHGQICFLKFLLVIRKSEALRATWIRRKLRRICNESETCPLKE